MRFSIVIPVYNSERFLHRCIDSVLNQTYRDWEILLVNDGSTDNSGSVIDGYASADERVRVLHQNNMGQLYARRNGLELACGDYVLFLDSDDFLRSDTLAVLCAAIEEYGPDIIMFGAKRIGNNRDEQASLGMISESVCWMEKAHIYSVLVSGADYNSLCLKAWKRELFLDDKTDYSVFAGICWGEDKVQLLYPMTQASKVLYLPEMLYCYQDNPDSAIHKSDMAIPAMLSNDMFELLYSYMKCWNMDTPEFREAIGVYYLRNYVNVYYRMRKICKQREHRKKLRSYNWDAELSKKAFRYIFSKRLSTREKTKVILARYFRI